MTKRHLLEEGQQRRALTEFNNLQSIGELVDWDPSPSGDPRVYADSAYRSGETFARLRKRGGGGG